MPDFPTGIPTDLANADPSETLFTMHAGASHVTATNRLLLNIQQLATKLGIGTSAPGATAAVLRRSAAGTSAWGQVAAGDMTPGVVQPRDVTLVVAASNAPALSKAMADYVCTGTGDQVTINSALAALPAGIGGTVLLTEGQFNISAAGILTNKASSVLRGLGIGTTRIRNQDGVAAALNGVIIGLNHAGCSLLDLTVDGNKANNAAANAMVLVNITSTDCLVRNVQAVNPGGTSGGGGVAGSQAGMRVESCVVSGCPGSGISLTSVVPGAAQVRGCIVSGCGTGIAMGGSMGQILDCQLYSNVTNGIAVTGGTGAQVVGCSSLLDGSVGISLNGSRHLIAGNNVEQAGAYGINIGADECAILGNRVVDCSQAGNGTFSNFNLTGSNCYVDGNISRRGTRAAKPGFGFVMATGSNNFIGVNDFFDSGNVAELNDTAVNTRRAVKQQLDYTAASDLHSGTAVPGATWTDVGTNQSFRVDHSASVVRIAVRGFVLVGANAAGSEIGSRLVIDSAATPIIKPLGGGQVQTLNQFVNALEGVNSVDLVGLAIGTHTVKTQVYSNVAGSLTCRPSTATPESYSIQVTEIAR